MNGISPGTALRKRAMEDLSHASSGTIPSTLHEVILRLHCGPRLISPTLILPK